MITIRLLKTYWVIGYLLLVTSEAQSQKSEHPSNNDNLAIQWAKTTLDFIQEQQQKTPTFISRSLGYMGLAMYESVVHSNSRYQSIAPQLNGLDTLPLPNLDQKYDWETVLNASQRTLIEQLWQPQRARNWYTMERVNKFAHSVLENRKRSVNDTAIIQRSVRLGEAIANKIFTWSKTDGGHEMNFDLFDPSFKYPNDEKKGYWKPPVGGQSLVPFPLHPYWGQNRKFVANNDLPMVGMIPFSTDSSSLYYKQFLEVYHMQKQLTQEQKEIALWWGDDPAKSTTPPGHSYQIAIILAKQKNVDLVTGAMLFARVGMACADAFVHCWKVKYTHFSERPRNYIRNNIDENFVQFWPEPPFPGFPSGHSIQIAATVEVLIDVLGNDISFTDTTHEGKSAHTEKGVAYKKRSYTAISQLAEECGISRLYGGIHTRQDNEVGLGEGKKIGMNVNQLKWLR